MRVITLLLTTVLLVHAAPPLPIEWEMTTAAFEGQKAIVNLDSGARVEGNWLSVTPTTFTIDVERAKGKNRPPKGVQTFERSAIIELRVQERRISGRVTGTIFGYLIGWALAFQAPSSGAASLVFFSVIAVSHLVGLASDKATRVVHIKP